MSPRLRLLVQTVFGAMASALVPVLALLTLDAAEYGTFSLAYLMFAFGWSLELSIICDTWARSVRQKTGPNGWREVSHALIQLSTLAGVLGGVLVFVFFGEGANAVAMGLAVLFNLYRLGGRFFNAASANSGRAAVSDALTVLVFVAGWVAGLLLDFTGLLPFAVVWGLSNLVGALVFMPVWGGRPYGIGGWISSHRKTIKPLLTDSVLMDVGAIAVPTLFAPSLGPANFGIYRGIASVATPVQLILDPLRPVLSHVEPKTSSGPKILAGVLGAAVFLSLACYAVLVAAVPRTFLQDTVLGSVAGYALPASVFVASNLFGHFYYVCSRGQLVARRLYLGRVVQTVLSVLGPTAGLLAYGLSGAIWGFTLASVASSVVWFVLLRQQATTAASAAAAPR
ncbi:hypothetical protein LJ753_13340 [Arthrobacter sp. zg-Y20]|uniref:hypothetical protein n=1 Tax=unclassified Arthrobacter TaxID=235627 RepID=UPI001D1505FD|nr:MULTISPECIES: hypothetical protein [unclassified Arthrobacter]MCC3276851.1 hypothetical protein [Arthrobacter sp. zg-Y20]MDK1317012.1 hypothetical protein [Arthrobacter sp. zg.Y20]WIB05274.1 hypothetical protein QNO06_12130 [Arthrobacter sp. zg-Y20]